MRIWRSTRCSAARSGRASSARSSAVPVGLGLLLRRGLFRSTTACRCRRVRRTDVRAWAFLYAAAATAIVALIGRSRAVAVGLALWLAALLPTQSFVPKLDALTNRPLSLALAGLLLATAPLIAAAIRPATNLARRARLIDSVGSLLARRSRCSRPPPHHGAARRTVPIRPRVVARRRNEIVHQCPTAPAVRGVAETRRQRPRRVERG